MERTTLPYTHQTDELNFYIDLVPSFNEYWTQRRLVLFNERFFINSHEINALQTSIEAFKEYIREPSRNQKSIHTGGANKLHLTKLRPKNTIKTSITPRAMPKSKRSSKISSKQKHFKAKYQCR